MLAYEAWGTPLAPRFGDPATEAAYLKWADLGAPEDSGIDALGEFVWRYALELVRLDNPTTTFQALATLCERFEGVGIEMWSAGQFASDALVLAGEFARARDFALRPELGATARAWADRDLTLTYWLGERMSGAQLVALAGPRVTSFGRDNFDLVAQQLDIQVRAYEEHHNVDMLARWAVDCRTHKFQLYAGGGWLRDRETLHLSAHPPASNWIRDRLREAENVVREDFGIPRVGEGWVEETRLFYALQERFEGEAVVHHASPTWLGRQHLDILFPSRRVAVEYHGQQHDRPVEFFGGERAYAQTVKRDRLKAAKCRANGVALLVIRPGYDFEALVRQIDSLSRSDRVSRV
jgi:hypothetical protein